MAPATSTCSPWLISTKLNSNSPPNLIASALHLPLLLNLTHTTESSLNGLFGPKARRWSGRSQHRVQGVPGKLGRSQHRVLGVPGKSGRSRHRVLGVPGKPGRSLHRVQRGRGKPPGEDSRAKSGAYGSRQAQRDGTAVFKE